MHLLLVEDHTVVAEGLQFLLGEIDSSIAVCCCSNLAEAKKARLTQAPFDMVLLDLGLPDVSGLQGLQEMRTVYEGVPIAVLSGETNADIIRSVISAGAMGFVPKSASSKVLVAAMRLILAGGTYLPPQAYGGYAPAVPAHHASGSNTSADLRAAATAQQSQLTDRQLEILLKAVQGKPNKIIARETNLAEGTVKAHLSAAYRIINVSNRTEAVFKTAQLGYTMAQVLHKI